MCERELAARLAAYILQIVCLEVALPDDKASALRSRQQQTQRVNLGVEIEPIHLVLVENYLKVSLERQLVLLDLRLNLGLPHDLSAILRMIAFPVCDTERRHVFNLTRAKRAALFTRHRHVVIARRAR